LGIDRLHALALGRLSAAVQAARDGSVEIAFVDQGYTGDKPAAAACEHGIQGSRMKVCGPIFGTDFGEVAAP
jgi:hypothetical protein